MPVTVAGGKREALAVGRKARKTIKSRNRMQRPRPTGIVQPEDRPLRFPFSAAVDEDPGLGKGEIPALVLSVADIFDYRLRLSGERQPAEVETRGIQHVLVQPDQVPARKVAGEKTAVVNGGPLSGLE